MHCTPDLIESDIILKVFALVLQNRYKIKSYFVLLKDVEIDNREFSSICNNTIDLLRRECVIESKSIKGKRLIDFSSARERFDTLVSREFQYRSCLEHL